MAKILVIGSNAPSGANFCAHALKNGFEVIATSRSPETNPLFLAYKWREFKGIIFEQIDLNHDIGLLKTLIRRHRPRYILNFASQGMVAESWKNPSDWMQTNVVANSDLLELLRNVDFLERYIHFSTPEVYGSTNNWVSEHRIFTPSTPYAVSRAAGDMNVSVFFKTYKFPSIITRSANFYGEGQRLYRVVPRTFMSCSTGQTLYLDGGGRSVRSYIHFEDVSEALILLLLRGKNGEDYHISPRSSISILELVKLICQIMAVNFDTIVKISEERLGKDQACLLDSTKIRKETGWSPKVPLEEGLTKYACWHKKHLSSLLKVPQNYVHKQ